MSPDLHANDRHAEARRQIEICNACRYCEGYCAVFPALMRQTVFADGDLTQLANLCHNCRGCYYACQYTPPHEFALNLPAILADVRQDSWERHAWPAPLARRFHASGAAVAGALVAGIALMFLAIVGLRPEGGSGFYAHLSHGAMVAIFAPAFVLPLAAIAVALRRYWQEVGGGPVARRHLWHALRAAGTLRNLDGGQGQGCNFEEGDRFTDLRRRAHQAVALGFALCFGATAAGTVMHYVLGMPAPYGLVSLPKLLGVPGGLLMVGGCAGLVHLKLRAERSLGAARVWGGEMGFTLLLGLVAATGLALMVLGGAGWLAVHLGAVLTLFLLMPYSKMAHGFFRFAALVADAQRREAASASKGLGAPS